MTEKIFKATNGKDIQPVYSHIAHSLLKIDALNHIKIFNNKIQASNLLSSNGKKTPLVHTGKKNVVALQLVIDSEEKTIEFTSVESNIKGYGRKLVFAVVEATPDDWTTGIAEGWINGFFRRMIEEMPKIKPFKKLEGDYKYFSSSLRGI